MARSIGKPLLASLFSISFCGRAAAGKLSSSTDRDGLCEAAEFSGVVTTTVLLLEDISPAKVGTLAGQATEILLSGGVTVVVIEVDGFLFGELVQFDGSGVFDASAGDFSGILTVGAQTTPYLIGDANLDFDAGTFGWDSFNTNVWSAGATQENWTAGNFDADLEGDLINLDLSFDWNNGIASMNFAFNPTVDITTTLLPTGELISEVKITETLVPVPGAVWLFGSTLALLGWIRRKAI